MKKYTAPILLVVFAVLNSLDWFLTKRAIEEGGYELNPYARWLIEHGLFDITKFTSTLLALVGSGGIVWAENQEIFEKYGYNWLYNVLVILIAIMVVLYTIAVFNNAMKLGTVP